jgi:hypothetical protein
MPEFEVPATSLLHLRAEFDEQSLYAKLDGDGALTLVLRRLEINAVVEVIFFDGRKAVQPVRP